MSDAPSEASPQHLWEVYHPYYCSESNFYSNECYSSHKTLAHFLTEEGDADTDYNLLFRWDWQERDGDGEVIPHNGDDYYRNGTLQLFFVGQRKGLFRCVEVQVCRADEPAIREYLAPRLVKLQELWAPLWPTSASDGASRPEATGSAS